MINDDALWRCNHTEIENHVGLLFPFPALRSEDTRTIDAEGDDEDEGEDVSSTVGPRLPAAGVTERSNSTSKGRSSQILYVITSSPGKPEHNMPGQWAGPGETSSHSASMSTPMMHYTCTSLYLCRDVVGGFLASALN